MASMVDIISLDNFESKIPKWDPTAPSHLFALVDMGSNGIRFSISDLSPPRSRLLKCVYRERAGVSLFDALSPDGTGSSQLVFPEATMVSVAQAIARFRSIALDYQVPLGQMSVFATEAMRRASNAASMLDAIKEAAPGISIHILAPEVETLFGSMGARSGFVDVKGLFLDLGGGSVQMTYIDTSSQDSLDYEINTAKFGQSMPFGAARLTNAMEAAKSKGKASVAKDLRSSMLSSLGKLCSRYPELAQAARAEKGAPKPGVDIYLCGGGFRGYGSMLMHTDAIQPYPIPLIGSYTVPGKHFKNTEKMLKVNEREEHKIFGMSKRRRKQFPAIVAVVEALIDVIPKINTVTFCSGGNREGALLLKLPKEMRDANPLLIATRSTNRTPGGPEVVQAVVDALQSAVPSNSAQDSIVSLSLLPVLAQRIWERCGEDEGANSSFALHDAVNRDPSIPGLNHLARASLAISLWARWGGGLPPIDSQLHQNLQLLLGGPDSDGYFWAAYIGAAAAALTRVIPSWPASARRIRDSIRFEATMVTSNKKDEIHTSISVAKGENPGAAMEGLRECFKVVGKHGKEGGKVEIGVYELPNQDKDRDGATDPRQM